jgi:hypothetical protein
MGNAQRCRPRSITREWGIHEVAISHNTGTCRVAVGLVDERVLWPSIDRGCCAYDANGEVADASGVRRGNVRGGSDLAISLFLPWYWNGGPEFGGSCSAFQAGGVANKVIALIALISALSLMPVIFASFSERRSGGESAPPIVLLVPATIVSVLTLIFFLAPTVSLPLHGSLSRRPGADVGFCASAIGLLSTFPLQRVRRLTFRP